MPTDEYAEMNVVNYLQRHPEFFLSHEALLQKMRIPHKRGEAVSLVERQLAVLRNENQQLQRQLNTLIKLAENNEKLNQRIQRIVLRLLDKQGHVLFDSLYQQLTDEFNADGISLRLFTLPPTGLKNRPEYCEYDAQVFRLFESVLGINTPICGRLSAEQNAYLFAKQAMASAVLIPLGMPEPYGILAIASRDINRYHSGMATDLLKYLGEVITYLMQKQ
jgi:uncharacterized protein YigA (DUF484 family)